MTVCRRISVALLMIILLASLAISALAVAQPTFSIDNSYALPGDQLNVPISFSNNEQFNGMVFTLTFDPKVLTPAYSDNINECFKKNLSDVPVNQSMVKYTEESDHTSATLKVTLAITENVKLSSGVIGTVKFDVKPDAVVGKTDIQFTFGNKGLSCMDSDGVYHFIEANTVNGSVTVCDMFKDGKPVTDTSTVPTGKFTLTVPSFDGANMILGGYNSSGQLILVSVQTASGQTCTFSVNNSNGKISVIKIFTLDEFAPTTSARCLGKSL